MILPQSFYNRPALQTAQDLLGCFLVRNNKKFKIVETEAYDGPNDSASHASRGKTERNRVMFGAPGIIYVYLTYGMHYMLNIVTGQKNYPAAILIRAVEPVDNNFTLSTNGPARLTKSLKINKTFNGSPIYTKKHGLWIENGDKIPKNNIIKTTRIGVDYAGKYKDKKWRFYIKNNKWVSKK